MEEEKKRESYHDEENPDDLNLKANWNDLRGKITKEYSNISDDDLQFLEGNESDMINRLHQKTGKTKTQVRDWLQSLMRYNI